MVSVDHGKNVQNILIDSARLQVYLVAPLHLSPHVRFVQFK